MTPDLNAWATRWGVPVEALAELAPALTPEYFPPGGLHPIRATHETDTQARLRVAAGREGFPLWRNNNGKATAINDDGTKRHIRFGLGNDSKRVLDKIKSSDLIGCCPIEIGIEHVGRRVGIFTAVEVKHPLWKKPITDRDRAQEKFISVVRSLGGFAGFATHESHLRSITNGPT